MTSNQAQINTFVHGLDMDTDVTVLPNDRYRYAENVRVVTNDSGTTGALQNIEGVRKYNASIPLNETIIGTTVINDMAIVVTTKDSGYNRFYRVKNFDTPNPSQEVILQGRIGLCADLENTPNISIVSNYETDDNIKVYFTDGNSSVKVLHIAEGGDKYKPGSGSNLIDSNGDIINPIALDITPGANLPPFSIVGIDNGNLPSGVVQYCYQLFNLHGTESTLSSLSPLVHLTASNTSTGSQAYEGTLPNTSSGKSVRLSAAFNSRDFEKCRVIRLLYQYNNQPPLVEILDEVDIDNTQATIEYQDRGNVALGSMTIEEFNQLTGYQFIAKTLAKTNNRLFVANIQEDSWNPEYYDARAYRCNRNGQILLESANANENITFTNVDTANLASVPKNHDCINPYNKLTYGQMTTANKYAYTKVNGEYVLGGSGINISYRFVTLNMLLADDSEGDNYVTDNCGMNASANSVAPNKIGYNILPESGVTSKNITLEDTRSVRTNNYADPYLAAKFKSYQRDEVYRFGIIFYNKKHIPSPVNWIADIRFPHMKESSCISKINNLIGNPIGIQFTVRNAPEGAIAYEIVRCDRTEVDRTVIMNSALSNILEYYIQEQGKPVAEGTQLSSTVEARPTPWLQYTSADTAITRLWGGQLVYYRSYVPQKTFMKHNYARLVSPEICVQGESITQYLSDTYVEPLLTLDSSTTGSGLRGHRCFSVPAKYFNITHKSEKTVSEEAQSYFTYGSTQSGVDTNFAGHEYVKTITHPGTGATATNEVTFIYPGEEEFYSGIGLISKYYLAQNHPNTDTTRIQAFTYPQNIPYNAVTDVSAYRSYISDMTYTNWSMCRFNVPDNTKEQFTTGPAGPCVIIRADNLQSNIVPSVGLTDRLKPFNQIVLVNIKKNVTQYSGNTYSARQNSVYIPTGTYKTVTGASDTVMAFGGDTYIGVLDYPCTMIFQGNGINDYFQAKKYVGAYIPFESSINLNLLSGDMTHRTWRKGDDFLDTHMLLDITQRQTYHVQDKPFYEYNAVYSSQNGSKIFVPASIYAENNVKMYNRILGSQAKTSNEVLDNWTQFKVADYLDVDNQFGDITNLYSFKDRLFYFQNSALGIASVNERALIQDNNIGQLTLGTGAVLSRFDYVTNTNGSSVINDRSIVNSDNVLYWYDFDKNEICAYGNGLISLSKQYQTQSYLNELFTDKRNVTLGLYDKKYNEIWFKFYDKSLIYSEQLNRFTSFYTFNPQWALSFSDKVVAIKDNVYYRINSIDSDTTGTESKNAKIVLVVNKEADSTKVFDNIRFSGDFVNSNNSNKVTDIFTAMNFDTKDQKNHNINPESIVLDYREETYRLPIPRQEDDNDPLSFPARMRGKYLICEYGFKADDEHQFKLPYIATTYRHSLI